MHIALLMMLKNEEVRLPVSLASIIGYVDSMVIFDTGSTDNTVQVLKNFSEKHKIPLRLKQGEFKDFSTSRNESLDFADTFLDIDFLLLLDNNDELRGGEQLRQFAKEQLKTEHEAYLMCQEWMSGSLDKYFNTRFLRARCGWRYKGSVHEYLANTKSTPENPGPIVFRMPDNIVLFQDRTKDNNKSGPRFARDKVLLLSDHKKDPKEPRTLFYLAQTCSCLEEIEDSFYYYKLRSELDGFWEEKFHAYLRCGEISQRLNHDWHTSLSYYMKAIEYTNRAEPLIKIAQYYNNVKKFLLSYMFISLACDLPYPSECILFVDKHSYDYMRWHVKGIVCFYVGKFVEGKIACERAIGAGLNQELDQKNLKFYEEKLGESSTKLSGTTGITKQQFMQKIISDLKSQNSKLSPKQVEKLASTKWKNRNKV